MPNREIVRSTTCYELYGNVHDRQVVLTKEGERRLENNGLVVCITAMYPGGIGSSTTTAELARLRHVPLSPSTGNQMRQIAAAEIGIEPTQLQEPQLKQFLTQHQNDPELDRRIDSGALHCAAEIAKQHGIAFVDSKFLALLWEQFADQSSPLVLSAGIVASPIIATWRMVTRDCIKEMVNLGLLEEYKRTNPGKPLNPFADPDLMSLVKQHISLVDQTRIGETRRARYLGDVKRIRNSYPQTNYSGARDIANVLTLPIVDTSAQAPSAVAQSILDYLSQIPEVFEHITSN